MDSERPKPPVTETKPEDLAKLTVPEHAELRLARAKAHFEQMAGHVDALKAFYQTLTPEQKRTFEEFHAKRGTGMRHKSPPPATSGEKPATK